MTNPAFATQARRIGVVNRASKRGITRASLERLTHAPFRDEEAFDEAALAELAAALPRFEKRLTSIEHSIARARAAIAQALVRVESAGEHN